MKFQKYQINPQIKKNLAELGYVKPTDIQYKAIPSILKGEDVLAIAQTGTGKTAAFAIPVVDIILANSHTRRFRNIFCVIMEPTRELVIQTARVFNSIAEHTDISVLGLFGGVEQDYQISKLKKGVDILIATPGRLFDLRSQGFVNFDDLQIVILDEADHMLDLGFINDIRQLIRFLPRNRQTLFFSATINPEIKELAYSLVSKPVRIQISPKDPVSKNVDHFVTYVQMDDKRFFLERFISEHESNKILVFVRTKVRAERVKNAMQRVGIEAVTIHGDKNQQERNQVMKDFTDGVCKILIATDISARGIDIPAIDYVINYDLPDVAENYVHRVGRTGRAMNRGVSISFCSPEELELLDEIQSFIGKPITKLDITKKDYSETIVTSRTRITSLDDLLEEAEKMEQYSKKKRKKKS